ncbi:hypothetical protein ABC766_29345 [Methylobacterium fujisawaense]|uniref:hypothetical protein n=1 Tax=Methylobacterium fujisawaense TaxID=107400 RepID=UPI0031F53623
MSDGIPFGAASPLDDLSPELIARLLQSQQPQQPSPVDSLLFDRAGMGAPGNGFSGSSGTIVPPPAPVAQARPDPRETGALPQPPAAPAGDASPGPAARPAPAPAVVPGPADGAQPVNSFDPLSGQPVSDSPKPVAPAQGAKPEGGFDLGSALSRMSQSGLSDQLIAIGAGILSGRNFGEGLGQGLSNAQKTATAAAANQLQQLKLQREQAALTGNAQILKRAYPNLSDSELAAMATNSGNVTTALQILRDPTHGLPKTPEQMQAEARATAAGSMEGGAKPLDRIKGEAQAQAEGSAAGSKDDVQIIMRPDGSIVGVNKSRIGEPDGPAALTPVAPATGGARVWGTTGADGRVIEPPPGTPPGTPGAYDEKGMPHVALTQGTNQLPQKANAELDQAAVKAITESRAKAEGAIGTIAAINRQKEAIDKGIVSGAGADWRTQARAVAAQVLGIPDSYVTQSQLFDQAVTQKSAELAKAISQSGHTTNMDLQLGKTISSGDRSSVEAALRAGIEAQEILAKKTIDHHNASVDRFATPETAQRAGFFKVEQPEVYQYRPAAPDRSAVEAEMRRRGMMR